MFYRFNKKLYTLLMFYLVCTPVIHAQDTLKHALPGELLVKFRTDLVNNSITTIRQKVRAKTRFKNLGVEHWKLAKSANLRDVMAQLKNDPTIELVEPNYRRYPRSTHTTALTSSQARLEQINLPELWKQPVTREQPVKIAVIDDAFEINHEDLKGNIKLGYDALADDNDPSPERCIDEIGEVVVNEFTGSDTEDHGTQVLGVVGAVRNNSLGVDGAADNAEIYPIRIGCNYKVSAELAAVEWAIQNDVDIISISYGGPMFSEFERRAFEKARANEIVVVVAAGNFDIDNDRVADYPSGLDLPNILAVAATNTTNSLASWSQWGQTTVDIAAPGEIVGTTYHSSLSAATNQYNATAIGTSFSAPLVAGVLSSLMQRDPFPLADGLVFRATAAVLASAQPLVNTAKGRLATDGYVDAMLAYENLSAIEPVIVIKSVIIDDSESGNNNGEVDPGEAIKIKLTLENKGANATTFQAFLSASDIPGLGFQHDGSVKGYNSVSHSYGEVELEYDVDLSAIRQKQAVLFQLDLTGTYLFGTESFAYSRYFSLHIGTLQNGETVSSNRIRANDDNQEEMHVYHLQVPSGSDKLVITLITEEGGVGNKLDVLANHGSMPQFDYFYYPAHESNRDAVADGVLVGKTGENTNIETIKINNPKAGIYYIAVVVDIDYSKTNIAYSIKAEYQENSDPVPGCSIGSGRSADSSLLVLGFMAFMGLIFSRKSAK